MYFIRIGRNFLQTNSIYKGKSGLGQQSRADGPQYQHREEANRRLSTAVIKSGHLPQHRVAAARLDEHADQQRSE